MKPSVSMAEPQEADWGVEEFGTLPGTEMSRDAGWDGLRSPTEVGNPSLPLERNPRSILGVRPLFDGLDVDPPASREPGLVSEDEDRRARRVPRSEGEGEGHSRSSATTTTSRRWPRMSEPRRPFPPSESLPRTGFSDVVVLLSRDA